MQQMLPDFGDLVLSVALLFGALIVVFEALERRHERQQLDLLLDKIAREYADCRRLGMF